MTIPNKKPLSEHNSGQEKSEKGSAQQVGPGGQQVGLDGQQVGPGGQQI